MADDFQTGSIPVFFCTAAAGMPVVMFPSPINEEGKIWFTPCQHTSLQSYGLFTGMILQCNFAENPDKQIT